MFDPLERVHNLLESYEVRTSQVVSEVDWQNMNSAMTMLGFDMLTMREFSKLSRAEAVQMYYEGKLLMFRASK